jgi:tetratricopeptide (TPR) repeat protein
MPVKFYIVLILMLVCTLTRAQTPKQTAAEKCTQALLLEDEGNYDGALQLLSEAQKLDPANSTYVYETAYVWYLQKQYQKVAGRLLTLKDKPDSFDRIYQLLGKSYLILNDNAKADLVFEEGLKKFPKSGCLYLEKGVIQLDNNNYPGGLTEFEKGIELEPAFADNYYWATKLYCNSNDAMWGLIYGELFINLVRNGPQSEEISKLLYDTYKSQITFTTAGKLEVNLSNHALADATKPVKMSFGRMYEPSMYVAALPETVIDINSLDRIRQAFLKIYLGRAIHTKYPNALFDYQDKVSKAGYIEAYNHWLLFSGDEAGFKAWRAQNPAQWLEFTKWFSANPLKVDAANHFYKAQYDVKAPDAEAAK